MADYPRLADNFYKRLTHLYNEKQKLWNEHILFDWHWWIGVTLTIIPILVWVRFRDRENTNKLLLSGAFTLIVSTYLDSTGHFYKWYDYQYDVFPAASNYIPWDFVLIPISVMFLLQIKPSANPYLKGAVFAAVLAFLGLPLLKVLGFYHMYNWNYFYSFVVLFVIYILADRIYKSDLTQ